MSFSNQSPQQDLYDNSIYHDPTNVDGYALISPPSTYTFSVRSGHVPLPDWSPHQSSFSANLYETYVHLPHPSSNSHTHSTNTRHSSPRNDSQSIVSGVNAATTSTSDKALDSLSFAPLSSSSDPLLSHPMDSYYPRDRKSSDHHGLSYLADDYNYTIPPPSLGPHSNGLHPEQQRSPTASSYGAASHDFHHYDYSEPAQNPQPLAHGHLLPPLSFELPVQTGSQDLTSPTPYSGHQLLSPFVENGPLSPSISVAYGGHPSSPEAYIPHRRLSNESGRQSVFTSTLSTGSVYSINSSPVIEKIPDANSHQSAHPPVSPTGPFSPSQITSRQAVISPGSFSDSSALSSPVAQRSVTSHHTPAVSPTIAQPRVTAHTISPVASLAAESGLSSPVQPVPSNRTEPQVSGPSKEATSQNVSPPSTTNGAGAKEKAKTEFQCPGCDLTFGRLSALKQHMVRHLVSRDFIIVRLISPVPLVSCHIQEKNVSARTAQTSDKN
ncbi:hypothetical protein FRC02_009988 [Tulasnella sp. 418]|nr:hypothetical protein FRC02_009988 [Tulasnella sp. 418]